MPSKWKPRDPSIFPIRYSEATLLAYTTGRRSLLEIVRNPIQARSALDKFREWRFCLRTSGHAFHRCFEIERDLRICTSITETRDGMFELWITIKPKRMSSLLSLNPDLMESL